MIALFGKDALFASSLLAKAGSSLVVLGTLFIAWRLFTRAASIPVPFANEVDRGLGEACIRFHQRELERQRDLLRTVWRWYLGPLVPGFLVLFASRFVDAWAKGRGPIIACLGSALLVVLVFAGVGWLNARGARKLQWEIDALDRSNEGL